jgi:hypothetical protein
MPFGVNPIRMRINRARHSGARYAFADHHRPACCEGSSGLLGRGGLGCVRIGPIGNLLDLDRDQCNDAMYTLRHNTLVCDLTRSSCRGLSSSWGLLTERGRPSVEGNRGIHDAS